MKSLLKWACAELVAKHLGVKLELVPVKSQNHILYC